MPVVEHAVIHSIGAIRKEVCGVLPICVAAL